ncbi:MAG: efflux RND transporter periplasmic adaptor subunit [Oceanicaulis sp.]|nr:efflux RND transporter periplasmic adaptor subunit [Oceanicaulis sp.]
MNMKKSLIIACVVLAIAALFWWLWPSNSNTEYLHGDVEVREIRVASKVPGRVLALHVEAGDQVEAGQLLFELTSPELDAMLAQAEAAEEATKALQDEANAGLRSEEIEVARLQWQGALIEQNLMQASLARIENLYNDGLVSQQHYDEVAAKTQGSIDKALAAEAMYNMASAGAREEQLRAVAAQNRRAAAAVAEVEAFRAETRVYAPIAGEIANVVIHPGELAPQGYPVITLANPTDTWVVFNIREDKLRRLAPGAEFSAFVPALQSSLTFRVTKLNALPSFANWKQVRGTPGYDLKTFQIEAKPIEHHAGLRAGMSVILAVED